MIVWDVGESVSPSDEMIDSQNVKTVPTVEEREIVAGKQKNDTSDIS